MLPARLSIVKTLWCGRSAARLTVSCGLCTSGHPAGPALSVSRTRKEGPSVPPSRGYRYFPISFARARPRRGEEGVLQESEQVESGTCAERVFRLSQSPGLSRQCEYRKKRRPAARSLLSSCGDAGDCDPEAQTESSLVGCT